MAAMALNSIPFLANAWGKRRFLFHSGIIAKRVLPPPSP